jgi:Na+-driven multidrug efflux pump
VAWLLSSVAHWGPRGVYVAIPAAETAMTIASLVLFRRGSWKKKAI